MDATKYRLFALLLVVVALLTDDPLHRHSLVLPGAEAFIDAISITPSNTNGMTLGQLSWPQFLLLLIIFLQIVVLTVQGTLPLDVNLSQLFGASTYLMSSSSQSSGEEGLVEYELISPGFGPRENPQVSTTEGSSSMYFCRRFYSQFTYIVTKELSRKYKVF